MTQETQTDTQTKNIFIVDDHDLVREGLRALLEKEPAFEVVGETGDGQEAVRAVARLQPDVVLMDINLPGGIGGLEAIERILAKQPGTRILVLSAHEDAMHARRVLKGGAVGYLTKRSAAEELIHAIGVVHQGKTYLEPGIAQQMAMQQLSGERNPVDTLSEKEFKVFLELAKGKSVQDIADIMSLSPRTVGTHLYNIKQKLGASNSAELAIIAIRAGLIET